MKSNRREALKPLLAAAGAPLLSMPFAGGAFAQSGTPVRVGGTLALTGPLSATAMIHKLTGEIYVEQLNKRGGLLGRPVEWVLKDDQSKPDLARTLYEQLVTVDKVDLLIGPYATANILSAMGFPSATARFWFITPSASRAWPNTTCSSLPGQRALPPKPQAPTWCWMRSPQARSLPRPLPL